MTDNLFVKQMIESLNFSKEDFSNQLESLETASHENPKLILMSYGNQVLDYLYSEEASGLENSKFGSLIALAHSLFSQSLQSLDPDEKIRFLGVRVKSYLAFCKFLAAKLSGYPNGAEEAERILSDVLEGRKDFPNYITLGGKLFNTRLLLEEIDSEKQFLDDNSDSARRRYEILTPSSLKEFKKSLETDEFDSLTLISQLTQTKEN